MQLPRHIKNLRLQPLMMIFSAWLGFMLFSIVEDAQAQITTHVPSDQRADANFRENSNMDGNNVRATIYNVGWAGSRASGDYQFEYPKNTNRTYINLVAVWLAGEVKDENGDIIPIVDFAALRDSPENTSWSLEPVPGFQNPDVESIARIDQPETWPPASQGGWRDKREDVNDPGWVGSWNGFFGKDIQNADVEMFYRTSDDLYKRHNYIPDETDPTRGGLGFIMDVRVMAWTQILISDVIFLIHDILNDGTKRITKTTFLIWLADLVGGDNDDDLPFVDLQTSIAFLTDADRRGDENFSGDPVGLGSIKYMETPGNQVDGIDNDGDSEHHPELRMLLEGDAAELVPLFSETDFETRVLKPGDKIVLIDSLTFERRVIAYPEGGGTVISLGQKYVLPAEGISVKEDTSANLFDEDFDGLIDENYNLHVLRFDEITNTIQPVRYINYLRFAIGDTVKRGFVTAGKAAAWDYANVAPMIDESRNDAFDNDKDWNSIQDDVGLDGKDSAEDIDLGPDTGEGDGIATTGAGTNFPGEPNIDNTDVSETDMIGVSTVMQDPAFAINFNNVSDKFIWRKFMTPGRFYVPRLIGEYDLYVASGYFPIESGQRQRMAISVAMADGGLSVIDDAISATAKQEQARIAFETDYRFAQAPLRPVVQAVPGDQKVTLYWDDASEYSIDEYIKRQGGDPQDFEGYRIYRATDAAFLDAKVVTNSAGIPKLMRPIASFDKKDGLTGLHPVDIEGVKFDLGRDTGLQHTYVDEGLTNGQRYFYLVTAYDFGYEVGNIAPTESGFNINVDPEGDVSTSLNVVVVTPRAPVAGYDEARVTEFEHVQGSTSGDVVFRIVDPRAVRTGHEYEITFQDTTVKGLLFDELKTKNFTMRNLTTDSTLIFQSKLFNTGDENPVLEGFQLLFRNEDVVRIDKERSNWSSPDIQPFELSQANFVPIVGELRPNDYRIVFGEVGIATSRDTSISFFPLPSKDVNFKIFNIETGENVEFGFIELDGTDGKFSVNAADARKTDIAYFLEPGKNGGLVYTWQILLNVKAGRRNPQAGDTLEVYLQKPFLARDIYRFTMKGESESIAQAKKDLKNIKVVPNPYTAAASWEPRNLYNSGRGPRQIQFTHLPATCTIRIFNVNGMLVDTIEHESSLDDGAEFWDLLSKDNLDITYGIYVYHVDAPGIGEKTGTFAIIK
ncbi:MAG: hypothetical protein DWQ05_06575 [Calditrichaeota bacterium]|nr:MAG: hypothetical protein DWQ05_06575 [Calditrichota bacterium]